VAGVPYALEFTDSALHVWRAVGLKGPAVINFGGMVSIPGTVSGGLPVRLTEVFTILWIGSAWRDAAALTVLFVILLVWQCSPLLPVGGVLRRAGTDLAV
jgi:branched-chain amino acid transport system permease protein